MSVKFYKCDTCGNIIVKILDGGTIPVCCGHPMRLLYPADTDGAYEKHVPDLVMNGRYACITIGSVEHPMTPEHYIQFIFVKTNFSYRWFMLNPGDAPEACFPLDEGEEIEEMYEFCNIHGLWVKEKK